MEKDAGWRWTLLVSKSMPFVISSGFPSTMSACRLIFANGRGDEGDGRVSPVHFIYKATRGRRRPIAAAGFAFSSSPRSQKGWKPRTTAAAGTAAAGRRRRRSCSTIGWLAGKRSGLVGPDRERKRAAPWTEEEHRLFLLGLKKKVRQRRLEEHLAQFRDHQEDSFASGLPRPRTKVLRRAQV